MESEMRADTVITQMLSRLALLLFVVATLGLAACNTAEGVGRDIESTGDAIEDTARDVKD
jgi:predicted small secreted protein